MSKLVIKSCKLFDGEKIQQNKTIIIDGEKIEDVVDSISEKINDNYQFIDANNWLVAPAFIDLQVNGGGGVLFTASPSANTLKTMIDAHEKFGVLNILPTLISTDIDTIKRSIKTINQFGKDSGILGLHIEGPFINVKKGGIHSKEYIRDCTYEEIKEIYEGSEDCIKILTFAPEALDKRCMDYIKNNNTNLFIGHSNADFDDTIECFNNGACGVTHLFNAMSQLNSREPGIVGASLLRKDTWAGIIADGFHVDFNNVILAKKMKGNKLYLVTDAMPPVGIGNFEFTIGENKIYCVDDKCLSSDGTIAGSALNMNKALQNIVFKCNIEIEEALRMTSTYQADLLNMSSKYGYIRKNNYADLVFLNDNLKVVGIIKHGLVRMYE